jgi:hypothetical protein
MPVGIFNGNVLVAPPYLYNWNPHFDGTATEGDILIMVNLQWLSLLIKIFSIHPISNQ